MTPLGVEIRRLRASRRMTLKKHAALVGVTPAYLSALEHGHRGLPTSKMLNRIIAALELGDFETQRLRKLLSYSRPKITLDTSGLEPVATEVANRLAADISRMSQSDLNALLDFLRRGEDAHAEAPAEAAPKGPAQNNMCDT